MLLNLGSEKIIIKYKKVLYKNRAGNMTERCLRLPYFPTRWIYQRSI